MKVAARWLAMRSAEVLQVEEARHAPPVLALGIPRADRGMAGRALSARYVATAHAHNVLEHEQLIRRGSLD